MFYSATSADKVISEVSTDALEVGNVENTACESRPSPFELPPWFDRLGRQRPISPVFLLSTGTNGQRVLEWLFCSSSDKAERLPADASA